MKAIIVSDAELNALLDKLKLEQMRADNHFGTRLDPEAMKARRLVRIELLGSEGVPAGSPRRSLRMPEPQTLGPLRVRD